MITFKPNEISHLTSLPELSPSWLDSLFINKGLGAPAWGSPGAQGKEPGQVPSRGKGKVERGRSER